MSAALSPKILLACPESTKFIALSSLGNNNNIEVVKLNNMIKNMNCLCVCTLICIQS